MKLRDIYIFKHLSMENCIMWTYKRTVPWVSFLIPCMTLDIRCCSIDDFNLSVNNKVVIHFVFWKTYSTRIDETSNKENTMPTNMHRNKTTSQNCTTPLLMARGIGEKLWMVYTSGAETLSKWVSKYSTQQHMAVSGRLLGRMMRRSRDIWDVVSALAQAPDRKV